MARPPKWTREEKAEALRLFAEVGASEAFKRTGIPRGTIANWGKREGVTSADPIDMNAATATRVATIGQRKAALAEGLVTDAERLRAELFAPTLERKVVTVRGGHADQGTVAEIVDVKHARPTIADQLRLAQAIERIIATVQVLTGGLTASLGIVATPAAAEPAEPTDKRERALAVVHQLADRTRSA